MQTRHLRNFKVLRSHMTNKKIDPQDKSLKTLFQDFYRVPDYQREYVWGESDPKGEGGEEVDQFLNDIHIEFQNATKDDAPEYFIGTIVVCRDKDEVYDLIDGQQRTTTAYITLCAIRDALRALEADVPDELPGQIAASSTDWQGNTQYRLRLDLQYEDAGDILERYANGEADHAPRDGTRSIRNLGNLLLIELSINRSIQAGRYSIKSEKYTRSKFLLTKCQPGTANEEIGVGDKITRTVQELEGWGEWNAEAIPARQKFLTRLARRVWDVPNTTAAEAP